mmetsp:Transcript_14559/g.23734  ORF Transcript_14559/g.23734 Transcript_14559/m.23734 type:complete len:81 (+) Transcript_14559:172-414(+)
MRSVGALVWDRPNSWMRMIPAYFPSRRSMDQMCIVFNTTSMGNGWRLAPPIDGFGFGIQSRARVKAGSLPLNFPVFIRAP